MKSVLKIRNGTPEDYDRVVTVMPDWWNGRDLSGMVLKIFFVHFRDTIFIAEEEGELVGFLMGFFSQYYSDEAYIQFAGIHPRWRKRGLGRMLAERFFDCCKDKDRLVIRSSTAPINLDSIAFHQTLGFEIQAGDAIINGFPVTMDFHKKNDPKVTFRKVLQKTTEVQGTVLLTHNEANSQ